MILVYLNMFIEAIIVCVNYSDFLEITLPKNINHFDHIIIITTPEDVNTINYIESLKSAKISLIKTNYFTFNRAKFNKGLAINLAYDHLKYKDFICYLDSDIVLEEDFRTKFENQKPEIELFYGCPRRDFPTKQHWDDFISNKKQLNEFIKYRGSGYGFFAIHNYNSTIFQNLLRNNLYKMPYPYWFLNGSESDWVFRNYWGERIFNPKLGKFPECHLEPNNDYDTGKYKELPFECYHLGEVGKNHNNRVTEQFK